jgi:hypothetical protein
LDEWRRVADMPTFREYHGVSLLLPDGRVAVTGGTRIKFQYGPTSAAVEAYNPPYLFRGVRPEIVSIASNELSPGDQISLTIAPATQLTELVLMGVESHTHWVTGGIPRRLALEVEQSVSIATAVLPGDPNVLPQGRYWLYAMVDDIPSDAVSLEILGRDPAQTEVFGTGRFELRAQPNPTSGPTAIVFSLPRVGPVDLGIYHPATGRRVRELWNGSLRSGPHHLIWDGRDDRGRLVPPGIYLYGLTGSSGSQAGKVTVLR